MEKTDLASARRRMQSPNIKTRKRALRLLHEARRNAKRHVSRNDDILQGIRATIAHG